MPTETAPALISPDELAERLGVPGLVVLDIRSAGYGGGRQAFDAGHIPGAIHSDYVADGWRQQKGAAAGLLPDPERLSALFGRLGIKPDSHVVIVPAGMSSGDFSVAARIFWTFRAAGHRRLSMLDGGWEGWASSGKPVSIEPTEPQPTTYPVTIHPSVRATLAEVERAVREGGALLVDARGPKSFTGEEKSPQAARPGRLPGSINIEGAQAYDSARHGLKERAELEGLFAPAGPGPVVTFCNTGQAASTDWFVLAEVLGRRDVKLYDGSMSEWTADPDRPVETGPVLNRS
ncbi:sulfurtransferase [Enterovirga aerilata]|uniref:Sulfurtransferase n=1 Tax=Enterovirga aerilata TaxID=2730920 RepID=A0A849I383_9HYPH|nr:sulfurtransferase [Enterovirga sp. DB1703]NNM74256.1 sulfurtransferase [Enterovirga sp. DB1703]